MKIEKQDERWRDVQHPSREHGAHEHKHKSEGRVDVEGWISCHKDQTDFLKKESKYQGNHCIFC